MAWLARKTDEEHFPFCGSTTPEDWSAPGPWPLDRQCVLRLPEDLARRAEAALRTAESRAEGKGEVLDLEILGAKPGEGNAVNRHWQVKAWGELLHATLVDLPCHVESQMVPPREACGGSSDAIYKTADVQQMLIVHRELEPPGADECLDRKTFKWKSGLTPPTQLITERKFRGVPGPESKFSRERVVEACRAIRERLAGAPYVYEEETEVDEATFEEIQREQPENIWRPPPGDQASKVGAWQPSTSRIGRGDSSLASSGGSDELAQATTSIAKRRSSGNLTASEASSLRRRRLEIVMPSKK